MLIVKGENKKSVLANILMDKTNSICFQYYDQPLIFNSICVDSMEYSLNDFIECIREEFARIEDINENAKGYKDTIHYDYLIIYTNEYEEHLKALFKYLGEHRWRICCNDILVMCK